MSLWMKSISMTIEMKADWAILFYDAIRVFEVSTSKIVFPCFLSFNFFSTLSLYVTWPLAFELF